MIAFTVLALVGFAGAALATDCIGSLGSRCMTSAELPNWKSIMIGGDPCFLYNSKRYCFYKSGSLQGCSCTAECGCANAPVIPACDNSLVPQNPDCTADKTTYCSLDYTNPFDKVTYKNTMCLYCGVNPATCNNLCTRDLTATEKQLVVDKHNYLRRNVAKGLEPKGANGSGPQPIASDMFELVWDNDLATSAQRWSDQCPQDHDKNRLTPGYTYVGQNMADSWSSVNSPDKGLEAKILGWYGEVKDFPSGNVGSFSNAGATGTVGHYTQLVWGETKKIGCGFVMYMDVTQPANPYRQTLVCNYGVGGNMLGGKVYTVGPLGSACPNGVNDGLCKH